MDDLITIFLVVFFFWAGFKCINDPEKVQNFVYEFFLRSSGLDESHPMLMWIKSSTTKWMVRFLGLLCLINFTAQLFYLIYGSPEPPPF